MKTSNVEITTHSKRDNDAANFNFVQNNQADINNSNPNAQQQQDLSLLYGKIDFQGGGDSKKGSKERKKTTKQRKMQNEFG